MVNPSDTITRRLKKLFAKSWKPGQSEILLKVMTGRTVAGEVNNEQEESIPESLITLYNEAESWFVKRQILSSFAHNYSKEQLRKCIPGTCLIDGKVSRF